MKNSTPPQTIERLDNLYRDQFILGEQLHQLGAKMENEQHRDTLAQEYDSLLALNLVRNIEVSGNQITLYTEPISIVGTLVGEFRVHYTFGARATMHIRNLTKPVQNGIRDDLPHVSDGVACLGNIQSHVARLLGDRIILNWSRSR